jgi:hypothetical protein
MGDLGNFYFNTYNEGHREVLSAVAAEEDNLLAAWRLARAHGWWDAVASAMQGLRNSVRGDRSRRGVAPTGE